jgi:predicted transcriptional regulator
MENVEGASVLLNSFDGQAMISNSSLKKLHVTNGTLEAVNSSWEELEVGEEGIVEVKWWIQLEVLTKTEDPISGAVVRILDVQGDVVAVLQSDEDGLTSLIALTQERIGDNETLNTYLYDVQIEVDGREQQYELTVDSNKQFTLNFQPVAPEQPWLLYTLFGLLLVALFVGPTVSIERSRFALLTMFIIFYVKLRKENVLDQFTRGRIFGYIEANPGDHFGAIRKALSLSNGNAVYHLQVLEKQGFVKSRNEGMYKRFYSKGTVLPPDNSGPISEIHQRILSCIREAPGISQTEVASLLGLQQSTLGYQLRKLEKMGQIRRKRAGRRASYYLVKRKKK